MDLPVMADSRMDAVINAPCETIDLTEWVFGLTGLQLPDRVASATGRASCGKEAGVAIRAYPRNLG